MLGSQQKLAAPQDKARKRQYTCVCVKFAQLKMAVLYFDKLFTIDEVDASWTTIGSDQHAAKADILYQMTPRIYWSSVLS